MPKESISDARVLARRVATKLNSICLRLMYPFAEIGTGVSVHASCDISRTAARAIALGEGVFLAPDVWLNVEGSTTACPPKIVLGNGCRVGRRSTISAKNRIELEADVLLAPSVLVMDHNHEYGDPELPIHAQGTTAGGRVFIERNCWLGYGSVVFCGSGELVLGRNSIVAANSVVTKSFPAFSVVAGNPAILIKRYDQACGEWQRVRNGEVSIERITAVEHR